MRIKNKHFLIPDTQCKKGVALNHLEAAGNYILDKMPNVIIHLGDHWDMPSLSSYDKGTALAEGMRYEQDIQAGIKGMELLFKAINKYNATHKKKYTPRKIFLLGNHEERILRHVNANPELIGTLGFKDFNLQKYGWEVPKYLEMVEVDDVYYSHYFYNPNNGKPYTGRASNMLNTLGFSFTMGHRQGKDVAEKHLTNGKTLRGLVAGSYYQHEEVYKGPQGDNYWRGCLMCHEVHQGNYSLMELSLQYLLDKWL